MAALGGWLGSLWLGRDSTAADCLPTAATSGTLTPSGTLPAPIPAHLSCVKSRLYASDAGMPGLYAGLRRYLAPPYASPPGTLGIAGIDVERI